MFHVVVFAMQGHILSISLSMWKADSFYLVPCNFLDWHVCPNLTPLIARDSNLADFAHRAKSVSQASRGIDFVTFWTPSLLVFVVDPSPLQDGVL